MSWVKLLRLRDPAIAVIALGVAFLSLDAMLSIACGYQPQWMPPQIPWGAIPRFESHVAAVELLERTGQLDDRQIVVVLGYSAVEHDFDCRIMHANDPLHRYWLILGAGACNFAQLELYAHVLIDSTLRPSLVVIGLQQSLTHREDNDTPGLVPPSFRNFPPDLAAHHFKNAIRDGTWLYRNRDLLENAFSVLLYETGVYVRAEFHLPMSAAQAPAPDPWDVSDLPGLHGNAADQAGKWHYRMELLRPSHYDSVDRTVKAFARLVSELRQRSNSVVGLLVPETTRLRAAYLPITALRFHEAVAAAADAQPLPILDLQSSIPDNQFYDDSHLNTPGKRQLSMILPALLQ